MRADLGVVLAAAICATACSNGRTAADPPAPAKAIRMLDEAEVRGPRLAAGHYVEKWRRFAVGLSRIDGSDAQSAPASRAG